MKPSLKLTLVFAAGLVLGIVVSPLRWQFEAANGIVQTAYRFDRLTGRGWVAPGSLGWKPIKEAEPAKKDFNAEEYLKQPAKDSAKN